MSEYTESLTKTIEFLKTKSNIGVKHTTHVPEEFDSPTRVRHYNTVSYLISELLRLYKNDNISKVGFVLTVLNDEMSMWRIDEGYVISEPFTDGTNGFKVLKNESFEFNKSILERQVGFAQGIDLADEDEARDLLNLIWSVCTFLSLRLGLPQLTMQTVLQQGRYSWLESPRELYSTIKGIVEDSIALAEESETATV